MLLLKFYKILILQVKQVLLLTFLFVLKSKMQDHTELAVSTTGDLHLL